MAGPNWITKLGFLKWIHVQFQFAVGMETVVTRDFALDLKFAHATMDGKFLTASMQPLKYHSTQLNQTYHLES